MTLHAGLVFETMTVDDVEVRELDVVENGERVTVSYAAVVQGVDTAQVSYRDLRRVCTHLGVRFYKNRTKNAMKELIALTKIYGRVPDSYRLPTRRLLYNEAVDDAIQEVRRQRPSEESDEDEDEEGDSPILQTPASPVNEAPAGPVNVNEVHSENRADLSNLVNPATDLTPSEGTEAQSELQTEDQNEQEINEPSEQQTEEQSDSDDSGSDDSSHETMTIKDRAGAMNMLLHIREQIEKLEHEVAVHALNKRPKNSYVVKKQRLNEDLEFYVAERRALMHQLENTRFH